jgi:hypothetical protein
MGLDYNYLLYFERDYLWDALWGVVKIAEPHHPPTIIRFPDRELVIPLDSWLLKEKEVHHSNPEFSFSIVLRFEEDEAIQDYMISRGRWEGETERSPLIMGERDQVMIGYIYLTIYADLSQLWAFNKPIDLVLFKFGTTGTRMSLLFSESESIRRAFSSLLENHHGVCGIFDRENYGGEVFWWKGLHVREYIEDVDISPDEIEDILRRGWGRGEDHSY